VCKNGAYDSEATAIRLLGMALEKIERDILYGMGGFVGGSNPSAQILTMPGNGMMAVSVSLVFDMEKLEKYLEPSGSADSTLGHRD
jgi:hypothetical protein